MIATALLQTFNPFGVGADDRDRIAQGSATEPSLHKEGGGQQVRGPPSEAGGG